MTEIVSGIVNMVEFEGETYEQWTSIYPVHEIDQSNAWQIRLYHHNNPMLPHYELWVKWDGLENCQLQLIYAQDYVMPVREPYSDIDELQRLVNEYAESFHLSQEERQYAHNGIKLAYMLANYEIL